MFENLFRKDITPVAAATSEPDKTAPLSPDGAPRRTGPEGAAGASAAETQAWQDRILAAGSDDEALLQLARQAPTTDLKLAALQALTLEDSFKHAMREFREQDKRLYRAARSRWQAASAKREANAAASALIAGARALLDQQLVPANRVAEFDRAWAAVNRELLDPALPVEFAALREQLGARLRARGESEQALTRWLPAVDSAVVKLTASLAGVAQGGIPATESEALAANLLELLSSAPDTSEASRIENTDAANRALALASSVVQRAKFLQSLPAPGVADDADEKSRIEQWRAFPEVSEGELHAVLASRFADWRNARAGERQRVHDAHRAHEHERSVERDKQRLSAIQRDVEAAEAAHAAGHVADLTRLLTTIDRALKRGPVEAALTERIESLRREQLRLRDWQRWGGGQRREQLAAEAQELARTAAGKIAINAHAEAIGKLRERWKELDRLGAASNQVVWLNFDGALKSAYAPVAAHLEKLRLARNENLAKRNQIIDGLVQAAAKWLPVAQEGAPTPAARPDWRALAHTLEEAQIAWRKLGPVEHTVPRKALQGADAVTARYAAAAQALEAPLKEVYGEARRQREQLVAAAKDLGGSHAAARDVVDNVRRLQTQWQAVAKSLPLPRRDENTLWAAFKTATDAIFAARDAARAAKEAEFSGRIKEREAIIERLAAALPLAGSASDTRRAMAEADAAWRASPEVARPQAARLDARYRAARDAATRRLAELAAHASQARYDALIAAMALCHEREARQDPDRAITDDEAADLEARWNAVENLPEAWKARLEARFRGDGPSGSGSASGSRPDPKSGRNPGEDLPDTLLNLEVACGIESPGEFLAARQLLKLRALKSAMEARQTPVTTPADIERWLLDAAATPRPDELSRERLAKIIAAVRLRRPA